MIEFSHLDIFKEALWALENADYSGRENREDLRRAAKHHFRQQIDRIYELLEYAKENAKVK